MTSTQRPRFNALAVCGPTAVGKSDVAIQLARAWNGKAEIVNLDSVQVYRGLDIGSAKLTVSERGGIPHHLFDLFPPNHSGNVAQFREAALDTFTDLQARGVFGIGVGGSGMYLTALLHGLADVPATPPELREQVQALSTEMLYEALVREDPVTAARLHPRDRQRVSRALEVVRLTGGSLTERIGEHVFGGADVVALVVVLCRPRSELYERIDRRAEVMVRHGIIEETEEVLRSYGEVPILKTLGYRQVCDYLAGRLPYEALAEEIALKTRQFAKRQMTYWRNEPRKRGWLTSPLQCQDRKEEEKHFQTMHFSSVQALYAAVNARFSLPFDRTEVWYVDTGELI